MRGRDREVAELVALTKARAVALLLQGKLDQPLTAIASADFDTLTRAQITKERARMHAWRDQGLRDLKTRHFANATPTRLAKFFDFLLANSSHVSLGIPELREWLGPVTPRTLRGAPSYATVRIGLLGLQFEFPEMHLYRDLAWSFDRVLALTPFELEPLSHREVKALMAKHDARTRLTELRACRRFAVLQAFHLVEAYVNGLAWTYLHDEHQRGASLSDKDRQLLAEQPRFVSLEVKLLKYPVIMLQSSSPVLREGEPPLREFLQLSKPFRDSVVHASPFQAPGKWGGYAKLEKIYSLGFETTKVAVESSLHIIAILHRALGDAGDLPGWVEDRDLKDMQAWLVDSSRPWVKHPPAAEPR